MQKVTITKTYITDKDKNGNLLKSKDGKPYTRMSIKCNEYGDKWISGFQNKSNQNWKEGDTVEVIITQKGEYLNFETPKKDDLANEKMDKILAYVKEIHGQLKIIKERLPERNVAKLEPEDTLRDDEMPDFEPGINPEDIPF